MTGARPEAKIELIKAYKAVQPRLGETDTNEKSVVIEVHGKEMDYL